MLVIDYEKYVYSACVMGWKRQRLLRCQFNGISFISLKQRDIVRKYASLYKLFWHKNKTKSSFPWDVEIGFFYVLVWIYYLKDWYNICNKSFILHKLEWSKDKFCTNTILRRKMRNLWEVYVYIKRKLLPL